MRSYQALLADLSLRNRLLLLVIASLLPLLLLAGVAGSLLQQQQRRYAEATMRQTVRLLSSHVDRELGSAANTVQAIARGASEGTLGVADVGRFTRASAQILQANRMWLDINLLDLRGQPLIRVSGPTDVPALDETLSDVDLQRVLASSKPIIGQLQHSAPPLRVPIRSAVVIGGKPRYILVVNVGAEMFASYLHFPELDQANAVTIFDPVNRVAARFPDNDRYAGTAINAPLGTELARSGEGWRMAVGADGRPIYGAYIRSPQTGWGVAFSVPRQAVDARLQGAYSVLAIGLVLSVLIGAMAATLFARQITEGIAALRNAANLLGERRPFGVPMTSVPDFRSLGKALSSAAQARSAAEASLEAERLAAEAANRQKDELLAMLARKNEELERFAYLASHDLQTPLRAVSNFTELLQRDLSGQLSVRQADWLARVLDATQRMHALITDLLSYASADRVGPLERVRLDDELAQALALLTDAIDETRANVTVMPLPEVDGHAVQLRQVLYNLVANALHHSGERPPHVTITSRVVDGENEISVSDDGVGIHARHHEDIFGIFRRLDRHRPGTGIGLALCRRVVELHGGRIRVESVPGHGSTFRFTLPLAPTRDPAGDSPSRP